MKELLLCFFACLFVAADAIIISVIGCMCKLNEELLEIDRANAKTQALIKARYEEATKNLR